MFGQSVEICQWMEVPSKAVTIAGSKGEVEVSPPSVHIGYKPIPLLLISYRWRGSQVCENVLWTMRPSPGGYIDAKGRGLLLRYIL